MNEQTIGLIKDLGKILGPLVISWGWVTASDWVVITTVVGSLMTAAPVVWSIYDRTKAQMVAKVNALPEVAGVITKPTTEGIALANAITSPTVVPAGTVVAADVAK